MLVYLFVIFILLLGSYSKNARPFYVITFFLIFVISAFREPSMSGDFANYERIFNSSPFLKDFFSYGAESLSQYTVGYVFLNSMVKTLANDYRFFQIFHSFLGLLLLGVALSKLNLKSKDKCYILLTIFCFSFIWYFWNILRQNLANLLFWLFVIWYYKKSPHYCLKTWIIILGGIFIPSLFHSSGLINFVLFPLMILVGRIPPIARLRIIVPLSIAVYFLSSYLMAPLLSIMINLIGPRYELYVGSLKGIAIILSSGSPPSSIEITPIG